MFNLMKEKKWIILILSLALLLRVIYLVESSLNNPTFFTPIVDSYTYDKLAVSQVCGSGMGPESTWQPLFYPYFLSLFYFIFGRWFLLVRVVQILLGLGTCFLTYHLGKRLFSHRVGLIAAFMIAISGPLIFYEGELLPSTWGVFWFLLSLYYFMNIAHWVQSRSAGLQSCLSSTEIKELNRKDAEDAEKNPNETKISQTTNNHTHLTLRSLRLCGSNFSFLGLGIICGIGITIRPTILLFYIAASLAILTLIIKHQSWKKSALSGSFLLLGTVLILGPVLIRNHSLTKHWILMPVSGGLNFYIGNNPETSETIATRPGEDWRQLTVLSRNVGIFTEPYGSQYFYNKTFNYISEEPISFAKGLLRKTTIFFNGREIPRNLDIYLFRKFSFILRILVWRIGSFAFPMGIILPFALLGMAVNLRYFKKFAFLYLFVLTYAASIILFFVTSRYRLPLIPVFCVFAASAIYWMYHQIRIRAIKRLTLGIGFLALLFVLCNYPLIIPEDDVNFESEMYMALGSVCLTRDEIPKAFDSIHQSIEIDPGNADAHNLLGEIYYYRKDYGKALDEFSLTTRINPEHAKAYKNSGLVLTKQEKKEEALKKFLLAVKYNPGEEDNHLYLAEIYEENGDLPNAIREYWTALRLKPDHIPTRKNLARILGKKGDWDTARELIAEAVRHQPRNANLRCDLGMIYGNNNQPEEAIKEFQEALRLQPDIPVALLNLGIIYLQQGKKEKAKDVYQRLKQIDEELAGKLKNHSKPRQTHFGGGQ